MCGVAPKPSRKGIELQKFGKSKKAAIFGVALGCLTIMPLTAWAGCGGGELPLVASSVKTFKSGPNFGVSGTILNKTGHALSFLQVTFDLYDQAGVLIGNAIATALDVPPGATWAFHANAPRNFVKATCAAVTSNRQN